MRRRVTPGLALAARWLAGGRVPAARRETAALLRRARLGLVSNPSAVLFAPAPVAAADVLHQGGARLAALFGPEHGVRGEAPAGAAVPHGADARTGLPVWSLYGEHRRPTAEMLRGLEALVVDLQDVGARFYTFGSTLSLVMSAAREAGLPVIVLDRPNPLGGMLVEGPLLEPEHTSFVGMHPIPVRHGATLGELARLWASFGAGEEPLVVPCAGWQRRMTWQQTGLPWAAPSPAMPDAATAALYPALCFLEGTELSEGRGTAFPFRWFGAPWIDAEELAATLNREGLPGAVFRPVHFVPAASKHAGVACRGCEVHVLEPSAFRPVATGVAVLTAVRRLYPQRFAWRRFGERYFMDLLAGTARLRRGIDQGLPWNHWPAEWAAGEQEYHGRLHRLALYE